MRSRCACAMTSPLRSDRRTSRRLLTSMEQLDMPTIQSSSGDARLESLDCGRAIFASRSGWQRVTSHEPRRADRRDRAQKREDAHRNHGELVHWYCLRSGAARHAAGGLRVEVEIVRTGTASVNSEEKEIGKRTAATTRPKQSSPALVVLRRGIEEHTQALPRASRERLARLRAFLLFRRRRRRPEAQDSEGRASKDGKQRQAGVIVRIPKDPTYCQSLGIALTEGSKTPSQANTLGRPDLGHPAYDMHLSCSSKPSSFAWTRRRSSGACAAPLPARA